MLNIGRLAAGGEGYYLDSVARGVEDYYTGSGEAPGYWLTEAAAGLGLSGRMAPEALHQVMAGRTPGGNEDLLRTKRRRVPGFDLAFRAPKSVSLVWALGDESTAAVVRDAHDQAVAAAVSYLEQHAAFSRRGRNGVHRVSVEGLVAAAFRHRVSRAGDPLLHTHVLVANVGKCPDGEWRTLHSPSLYSHAKTAGYLYQAALREQLSRRLGVEWTAVVNGAAEIVDVPREVIRTFSRRRRQIEAQMSRLGTRSAKAAQAATLETRQAKDEIDAAGLVDRWRSRAAEHGFGAEEVAALLGVAAHEPPTPQELSERARRLGGPKGLTAKASTFTRRDVIRAWCEQLQSGASVEEVLRLTDAMLAPDAGLTVELLTHDRAGRSADPAVEQVVDTLADRLGGPDGAALCDSTDLRASVAAVIASGWTGEQVVEALVERELTSAEAPDAVLVWRAQRLARRVAPAAQGGVERGAVIRRGDGRAVRAEPGERRYSTPELLALEQRLVERAVNRRHADVAVASAAEVDRALARRPSVSAEQTAMVRRLVTSGAGVEVVVGKAGAGKTFALDAAREAWGAAGIPVVGAALAARAAAELEAGAGIDSYTIDSLLANLDRPDGGLRAGTVVVVDEAAMVGTRKLARLLDYVERARGKAVLVGDHRQLPEVDAGGVFRGLLNRLDPVTLDENRRQRHKWERAALDELRAGDPAAALRAYGDHDGLVLGDTADAVRDQLVDDWWQAVQDAGFEAGVMIAARRSDVEDLNARARGHLDDAGRLAGPALDAGDREFRAGDRVLALHNDRRVGVLNGTRGTVTGVDPDERTVTVRTDDGPERRLPAAYLDAGHLDHGYAITAHKAQGLTTDRTWVLGSDEIYREWGYVALSRGRDGNRLYVVGASQPSLDADEHCHAPDEPGDRVAELARALERSRAQFLAVDHAIDRPAAQAVGPDPELLAEVLASAPPDPARELRWINEERDAAVEQLAAARRRLGDAETASQGRTGLQRRVSDGVEARRRRAESDVQRWQGRLDDIERRAAQLQAAESERTRWLADHAADVDAATELLDGAALTVHGRAQAAEFRPPRYLTAAIGERPDDPTARRAWREAALAIETYRTRHRVTDKEQALGDRPAVGAQRVEHDRVREAVTAVAHARELALPDRHPDLEQQLA